MSGTGSMEKSDDSLRDMESGKDPSFDALVRQLVLQHHRELQEASAEIARLNDLMLLNGPDFYDCDAACKPARPQRPVFESAPVPLMDAAPPPCEEVMREEVLRGALAKCAQAEPLAPESPRKQQVAEVAPAPTPQRSSSRRSNLLSPSVASEKGSVKGCRTYLKDTILGPLEVLSAISIVTNVVLVYIKLEVDGYDSSVELGLDKSGRFSPMHSVLDAMSSAFTAVFLAELSIKMFIFRLDLFYTARRLHGFHIFDAVIVVASVCDAWLLDEMGGNLSIIRVLRFIRVFRALRMVRTFEIFSKLRVLVSTVTASFFALFWSMVLLGIVMLIAALFLCQTLNTYLLDETVDQETRYWMFRYYGTPSKALWSVFEFTFSGGWPNYARPLVEKIGVAYAIFFLIYISAVVFAMFRIVTALFLRDTLCIANADTEVIIREKMKEKQAYAQKLRDFFDAADASGDGMLSLTEFEAVVSDERILSYLSSLEIDGKEARHLFSMLDDGDHVISVDEFVTGAVRLKGHARSQDVIAIMHDCTKMMNKLTNVERMMEAMRLPRE